MLFPLILTYSKISKTFFIIGIQRVIIYFTAYLCITKMQKFLHKSYNSVQYLLKCLAFGSAPNTVVSIGLFSAFIRLGDV